MTFANWRTSILVDSWRKILIALIDQRSKRVIAWLQQLTSGFPVHRALTGPEKRQSGILELY